MRQYRWGWAGRRFDRLSSAPGVVQFRHGNRPPGTRAFGCADRGHQPLRDRSRLGFSRASGSTSASSVLAAVADWARLRSRVRVGRQVPWVDRSGAGPRSSRAQERVAWGATGLTPGQQAALALAVGTLALRAHGTKVLTARGRHTSPGLPNWAELLRPLVIGTTRSGALSRPRACSGRCFPRPLDRLPRRSLACPKADVQASIPATGRAPGSGRVAAELRGRADVTPGKARRLELDVRTGAREEFVDVTRRVQDALSEVGLTDGAIMVYVPHTTAGVTINEGADPDVRRDILLALGAIVPEDLGYRHGEGNSPAHVKAPGWIVRRGGVSAGALGWDGGSPATLRIRRAACAQACARVRRRPSEVFRIAARSSSSRPLKNCPPLRQTFAPLAGHSCVGSASSQWSASSLSPALKLRWSRR